MQRVAKVDSLHQKALQAAKLYFRAEADLLEVLQAIDREKAYLDLQFRSLFDYAVQALKLSESTALNFINVARKAVQVPQLKQEIAEGRLSVSKARKVVAILTPQNQEEWIAKAKSLPCRALEKEVARVAPQAAQPERVKYVTETRMALSLGLDEEGWQALKRVQDLESQRQRRAVTLEETLKAMTAHYLEKNDPVAKAERMRIKDQAKQPDVTRQVPGIRMPLPVHLKRQVMLRDGGQCTHHSGSMRCPDRRWLDVHHIIALQNGGTDVLDNLTTLCNAHHRIEHLVQSA